jgi:hypothetical protein
MHARRVTYSHSTGRDVTANYAAGADNDVVPNRDPRQYRRTSAYEYPRANSYPGNACVSDNVHCARIVSYDLHPWCERDIIS